jgi:molybdate transport system ATP-binding protein
MSRGLEARVGFRRDGFLLDAAISAGAGETVALLGPNGSGKSTFISILAGLTEPADGRVTLDGRILDDPVTGVHVAASERGIGVVFQDLLLFDHMSVLDNVVFPLRAKGLGRHDASAEAAAALERVGLKMLAEAKPAQLSGGEAQRVALARALVAEPRLLLLDEPLSALDVTAREEIRATLRTVLSETASSRVLVTHDPVDAMTLADRIVIIEDGRTTQEGTPEEIRSSPASRYAADLVGVNMFVGRLQPIDEDTAALDTGHGTIVVPREGRGTTAPVTALLRPSDVLLHRERPEGSARNALRGRVVSVSLGSERARVRLDTTPPLIAEVTHASLDSLGVREGVELWASFKALEVKLTATP